MTTEDDFQDRLEAQPEGWQTRLVFADWLEERGDSRAEGYRALGARRMSATPYSGKFFWGDWGHDDIQSWLLKAGSFPPARSFLAGFLPSDWFVAVGEVRSVKDPVRTLSDPWERFLVRREAEDAAALAFARLPAARRAELLARGASA